MATLITILWVSLRNVRLEEVKENGGLGGNWKFYGIETF